MGGRRPRRPGGRGRGPSWSGASTGANPGDRRFQLPARAPRPALHPVPRPPHGQPVYAAPCRCSPSVRPALRPDRLRRSDPPPPAPHRPSSAGEFNCFQQAAQLRECCARLGVVFAGYSPLAKGRVLAHPVVRAAAAAGGCTRPGAVRWSARRRVPTIPMSTNPARAAKAPGRGRARPAKWPCSGLGAVSGTLGSTGVGDRGSCRKPACIPCCPWRAHVGSFNRGPGSTAPPTHTQTRPPVSALPLRRAGRRNPSTARLRRLSMSEPRSVCAPQTRELTR